MAIKINYKGATILQPGAYSNTTVNTLGGFPLADTGVVGIVGEAMGGEPGSTAGVRSFTVSQINSLLETYESGPVVDAALAAFKPFAAGGPTQGAQIIRIYKTNASVAASSYITNIDTVADTLFDVDATKYGTYGNFINMYVEEGIEMDDEGTIESDAAITFPLSVANGDSLVVNVNGTDYTFSVAVAPGGSISLTQNQLITLLNGTPVTVGVDTATPTWAAAKPIIASASGATKIKLTVDPAVLTAYSRQFEYAVISVVAGAFATSLGLTTASTTDSSTLIVTVGGLGPVRGVRGGRIITFTKNGVVEAIDENPNDDYLIIQYTGAASACVLNVKKSAGVIKLTTVATGVSADNLDITLSDYTISELVEFINNHASYTCVTSYGNATVKNAALLDWYDSIDIKTLPLAMKGAYREIVEQVNSQSDMINLTLNDNIFGQIETISSTAKRYLVGGAAGASSNTSFQNGFDALLATRCNTVLAAASRDATSDIADGLTDASSTYDIDSIVAMVDLHCRTASSIKNRSERNSYVGYKDTFANSKLAAKRLNSEFTSMLIQDVDVLDPTSSGTTTKQPHVAAGILAGMQSGLPIGEPTTHKYAAIYGISHQDYDNKFDIDDAIDSGICVFDSPDSGGYRVVVNNTTYGKDQNWCFNRVSVLSAAHYAAYNLRAQLEAIYVGMGRINATSYVAAVESTVRTIMDSFRSNGIIVGDATNGGLGYKDLHVSITGNTINIDVTITPVQGIDFILSNITLDTIRDQI